MEKFNYNWTSFKRRIYIINSSKKELFRKWTTAKGITEWFIEYADYFSSDKIKRNPDEVVSAKDNYIWIFYGGSKIEGRVLEVVEDSLFKFTFGMKDIDSDEDVTVTVTFFEDDNKAWFDILQDNMSDSKYGRVYYHISCNVNWTFHMNNMKSILENGHDLRVKEIARMHIDTPSAYALEQYEWSNFQQEEIINAPLAEVFKKWTTSDGISEWFLKNAHYQTKNNSVRTSDETIKSGDNYIWEFYSGLIMKGKIQEIRENISIKFTFGKKEPGSDDDVIVLVKFTEKNNRTTIHLEQSNIANNDYGKVTFNLSCMVGWRYFLTNLRSIFESGFDLREKNRSLAKETTDYNLLNNNS